MIAYSYIFVKEKQGLISIRSEKKHKSSLQSISKYTADENFQTYNINADDAACAIAKAVSAEKLAFLTDIEGLYKDINDKSSFISRLSATEAEELIAGGFIGGGMLPKLHNCISAIENVQARTAAEGHSASSGLIFARRFL